MLCKTLAIFWSSIRDEKVRQILIYQGTCTSLLKQSVHHSYKAKHGVFKMTLPNLEKAPAPLGTSFLLLPEGV